MNWHPTKILQQIRSVPTSTGPAFVMTDEGIAVIKTLGNPEGPHALAREWIVTRLAKWFGLQTFDIALIEITEFDEISNGKNKTFAEPGPAVATRFESGKAWDGKKSTLSLLENPEDITKVVIFDTWTRNRDRHCPPNRKNLGNVFLSEENADNGKVVLKAIDHTHCLANGDIDTRMGDISNVQDENVYGLFPGFFSLIDDSMVRIALSRLMKVDERVLRESIGVLPSEWHVPKNAIDSVVELLLNRAAFLSANFPRELSKGVQLRLDGFDE